MNIFIEPIESKAQRARAAAIRKQVFEEEWGREVGSDICDVAVPALHLLAWAYPGKRPVGTLSVIDTSLGVTVDPNIPLPFDRDASSARFAQLAVLKPYRGLDIPAALMRDAHRRFVSPRGIEFTWLLFDADRALSCSLCRSYGFTVAADVFETKVGPMCVLFRAESVSTANEIDLVCTAALHTMTAPSASLTASLL